MKANAPEKIYLQENTTTDLYEEWWPEWFFARAKDTDIEYTRTDAFIEKAAEWLKENIYQRVYKQGDSLGFPTAEFLEEFKKAMKL